MGRNQQEQKILKRRLKATLVPITTLFVMAGAYQLIASWITHKDYERLVTRGHSTFGKIVSHESVYRMMHDWEGSYPWRMDLVRVVIEYRGDLRTSRQIKETWNTSNKEPVELSIGTPVTVIYCEENRFIKAASSVNPDFKKAAKRISRSVRELR